MKLVGIVAVAGILMSGTALAEHNAVQFDVVLLRGGKVVSSPKEMAMHANLTKSPSIAFSVPGTNARFVIKPTLVGSAPQ